MTRAIDSMYWGACIIYIDITLLGGIIIQCLQMPKMPSMKHSHNSNIGLTASKAQSLSWAARIESE